MAEPFVNEVAQLVEVIYTRFILRDLIGKVVPGAIALVGVCTALWGWSSVHEWMGKVNGVEVVLFAALCWLATIALQWLGELVVPWVEYEWMVSKFSNKKKHGSKNLLKFQEKRKKLNEFLDAASPDHLAIYERFVVIREAAGNSSTALFVVLPLLLIRIVLLYRHREAIAITVNRGFPHHLHYDYGRLFLFWILGCIAAVSLRAMYFEHKNRQQEYMDLTVAGLLKPSGGILGLGSYQRAAHSSRSLR